MALRALLVGLLISGCANLEQAEVVQETDVSSDGTTEAAPDATMSADSVASPVGNTTSGTTAPVATQGDPDSTGLDMAESTAAGTDTTESGSDDSASHSFTGAYTGTLTIQCQVGGPLPGELTFAVDIAGVMTGLATVPGYGNGIIEGTVDALGEVSGDINAELGKCALAGTIDDAGVGMGTLACTADCNGSWTATS
ncbi:MAG: hypothetical protein JKY37_23815 [Nannocystaceae bacterium]|nr:hypothetical protein [Nannocystaceae bacterium]